MFLSSTNIGSTILLLGCSTLALHLPPVPIVVSSMPLPVLLPTNKTSPVPASSVPDFSALPSNSSLDVDHPVPVCDGNLLGFDMNRYSCLQAWNTIPTGGQLLTFGDRLDGTFNVQLPRRFSGRKCVNSCRTPKKKTIWAPVFIDYCGLTLALLSKRTALASSTFFIRMVSCRTGLPIIKFYARRRTCTALASPGATSAPKVAGSEI